MNKYLNPPTMLLRLSSCSPKNIPETAVPMIDSATDPPTRTRTLAHNGRSLSHKITAMVVGFHHQPEPRPQAAMRADDRRNRVPRATPATAARGGDSRRA